MLQNTQTLEERYHKFIKKVVKTGVIYCLKDQKEGVAICTSNEFNTEEGEEVATLVYWSEKALAEACKEEDWAKYKVTEIPLVEFMELWCFGMLEDEVVAGIDFDKNLFGYEEHPIGLLQELIAEAEATKKELKFQSFTSLADLKEYLQELDYERE